MSVNIQTNVSLTAYNTFGIEAYTKYFATYDTSIQLQEILSSATAKTHKILHIGCGSNLLFVNNFNGLVLHSEIKTIEKVSEAEQHVQLQVGSGVLWDDFVAHCVKEEYAGIENLSLIPGQVGAAAVQNIGAYGVEIKNVIESVKTICIKTGEKRQFSQRECQYGYRDSLFKSQESGRYIITHVIFRLQKNPQYQLHYHHLKEKVKEYGGINLQNIRKAIIDIRMEKLPQPTQLGNAGSFFMNPIIDKDLFDELKESYPQIPYYPTDTDRIKIPAGWLIEQAGLKGKVFGKVGIYDRQALVIVNFGGATGKEVQEVANIVQQTVKKAFGISLKTEVNYIV